ncbi:unnamed protein product [Brassica oleracea]
MRRLVLREDLHIRSTLSDSSSAMARWLLQILLISSLHLVSLSSQQETRFVYESFSSQEDLYLDASAKVLPHGILQLTNDSDHQIGRAFYKNPIQFSSFSTHFVCALVPKPGKEGGHGLTFLVSSSMDFSHAQDKRFLGAFNATTSGFPVLAIELDTIYNPQFNDLKSNHVGIDVNSPISVGVASASYYSDTKGKNESMNLLTGKPVQVWVDYDGTVLNVSIAPLKVQKPSRPLLSQHISLSEIFWNRSKLFVGFSAATGSKVCDHYILWWSFSTGRGSLHGLDISKLPKVPHPKAPHKNLATWIIVLVVCVAVAVLAFLVGVYVHRRKKYSEVSETWEKEFDAHRFSYKSLYKATKGFSKDEFLGKGGFGEVYRGTLPQGREIAVKRVSHNGEESLKQFLAEVVSMRYLKHRNLVPLFGYCRRKHELLLVSEYMPNGSLDEHLFDDAKSVLSWSQRLVVAKGIASALWYLHTGADRVVLHRDVKASNVMLDAEFNGRLGDFGMARFHEHGGNAATTAAVGTVGYMAPELVTMGASTGTDVYAFGVFMLEVACGRRPVEAQLQPERRHMIKWVCECWKKDALLDATDPRLGDEFSPEEVDMVMKLGLLCSNIVPESRPTMEQVVLYLNKNLPMPDFSPYTLGIGTLAPFMVDAASLLASSASWSSSGPSMSSSNHSPYACQPTDQPSSETKNSLHICTSDPNSLSASSLLISNGSLAASDPYYLFSSSHLSIKSKRDKLTNTSKYQIGHAFYDKPLELGSSFSTHFVCVLVKKQNIEGGHGIAFIVSPSMDFSHAQPTRYLGAFDASTLESPSSHVLAVELDTIWNPEFNDIKGKNHVGIDVNSPKSVAVAPASYYSDIERKNESMNLLSGEPIQVWVDYEGTVLNVSIAPLKVKKPSRPLLSHPISLSEIFPNISKLYVGFSASTGNAVSDQYIMWWSFSTDRGSLQRLDTSRLVELPYPTGTDKKLLALFIILFGCLAIVVSAILA